MEAILRALHEVEGVQATLVLDRQAQLLAHRAHALYDVELLGEVARAIGSALDSAALVHEDWELVTASFGDGKILVRNLGAAGATPGQPVALAVVADTRLNPSFAGVAIRVAAARLKTAFESPASAIAARRDSAGFVVPPPPVSPAVRTSASSGALPLVTGPDAASAAFLAACTRALATGVGPMAKVFVKEALGQLCGGERGFAREHAPALLAELERHIDDPADRRAFRKTMTGI